MNNARGHFIFSSQFILLIICGFLFASKIMVSKAALSSGIQPIQLGIFGNIFSGLLLFPLFLKSGEKFPVSSRHLILYLTLGIVSFAVPTVLSYFVVQLVGPAYTATVYSLSPLLTMTFAAGLGIERIFPRRFAGIVVGFLGMLMLVQQNFTLIDFRQSVWVFIGLLIPVSAALGNIIRSAFWPKGTSALAFSCGTLFSSSLVLAVVAPWFEVPADWRFLEPSIMLWFAALAGVSALSYVLNFRLQQIGGPVVFSQIGYWGTGFGVLMAAVIFGDVLTILSLIGLCLIICGGVLAKSAQTDAPPEHR